MLTKQILWLVALATSLAAGVMVAAQQPPPASDLPVFTQPVRRSPQPLSVGPRDLPPSAHSIQPLTLDVEVRQHLAGGTTSFQRHTVARTKDRIYMKTDGKEWHFARNVVDPRRVSAILVVHRARTLVHHEESDLRNLLGIQGWLDVLTSGIDPAEIGRLAPTPRAARLGHLAFVRYEAPSKQSAVREVWWNQQQLLASRLVTSSGSAMTEILVRRLRVGADESLLRPPQERYPQYKVVDLAEWLEGH